MLKCPMPGCCVVVAPRKGCTDLPQQKGALIRHLTGGEGSSWWACAGHNLAPEPATRLAELAVAIAREVESIPR